MSPNLRCYGDNFARTPHIDALAKTGVRYTRAFATAPVCSPSRACLVTGVYATSLGNPHLRCEMSIPEGIRGHGHYLREAGYFTTNNVKTDYNLRDEKAFIAATWDRCDAAAHWRQRKAGQPFFAIFNLMETHQSRSSVWPWEQFEKEIGAKLRPEDRADPAKVPLPPYYPDTPLARRAMARYYDCIAVMDQRVGEILAELEADGLADDTIVFFYSDHGMGMPRGKRLLHDSGMHVPLIIRFGKNWQHLAPAKPGETEKRLVSFVDFAPTLFRIADIPWQTVAGIPWPRHMQGLSFLNLPGGGGRLEVYGARDRVDEVFDTSRSVRDERWLYIRNFRPHLSWAQPEAYSDQSDFRRELVELAAKGKLGPGPMTYLAPKRAVEELYDTVADPHQLRNLASDPAHEDKVRAMRAAMSVTILRTRDLGLLPESDMLARAAGRPPYEMARDANAYPLERILWAADLVGRPDATPRQRELLKDTDAAVRYWAAVGLRAAEDAGAAARDELRQAMQDRSPPVRIEAAGAVLALPKADAEVDDHAAALAVLGAELESKDWNDALHAARTLQLLGGRAEPLFPRMHARLASAREAEGKETLAMFVRFALEGALRDKGE